MNVLSSANRLASGCEAYWQDSQTRMRLRYSFLGTLIFALIAHGYAYLNFMPSHDMLNYVTEFANGWEVSLGRFSQVLYQEYFRGGYAMPWLSAVLTILYSTLASVIISDLLEIKNRWIVFFSAGLMVANASMTDINASFQYLSDTAALALLLSCFGAYVAIRHTGVKGAVLPVVPLVLGMGLYQAYILPAVVLMIFAAMKEALSQRKLWQHQWRAYLRYILCLALTAVGYFAFYKVMMSIYHVSAASGYNGPAALTTMSLADLLPCVRHAYSSFVSFFFGFRQPITLFHICNILLFGLAGICLVAEICKRRLPLFNLFILALGGVVFPAVAQIMSILTKAHLTYFLASHALFLMYPAVLAFLSRFALRDAGEGAAPVFDRQPILRAGVLVLCAGLLYGSSCFSNELYTYKQVIYDRSTEHVAQMMHDIESTPGYEHRKTRVLAYGDLTFALDQIALPEAYRWVRGVTGASPTYNLPLRNMMKLLGKDVQIEWQNMAVYDEVPKDFVNDMPCYPHEGYCQMYGDDLVVRVSP